MLKEQLKASTEIKVRFSEVDSLKIVWHGHYIKYFEEGREAFGDKYGISYLDIFKNGLLTPLIKISCEYKYPLYYGDRAIVETRFVDCEAAKIIFEYTIFRASDLELVAKGETTQVFLNENRELILTIPSFFQEWKKGMGLIP